MAPPPRMTGPTPPPAPGITTGYIPWWVLLVVTIMFGILFIAAWAVVLAVRSGNEPRPSPTAVVVVVFPTSGPGAPAEGTPDVTLPAPPTATIPPAPVTEINLGDEVRVLGTGGDGLRLRVGPGLQETPNYLALENEVLVVQSGPTIADGFTWWFLVDPADDTRNGWAVENYLEVVHD